MNGNQAEGALKSSPGSGMDVNKDELTQTGLPLALQVLEMNDLLSQVLRVEAALKDSVMNPPIAISCKAKIFMTNNPDHSKDTKKQKRRRVKHHEQTVKRTARNQILASRQLEKVREIHPVWRLVGDPL